MRYFQFHSLFGSQDDISYSILSTSPDLLRTVTVSNGGILRQVRRGRGF